MMRTIVFAMIVSMLIMEATSLPVPLGEERKSELPKKIAEILNEKSPGLDKNVLLVRHLRSGCGFFDCFVALMGKRSLKKIAESKTAKLLQDPQNYNLNPQYIE